MAHYDRKYKLIDFEKAHIKCKEIAYAQYTLREEIDDYFANSALGHFAKLRRYNPPVRVATNPSTGEMWHNNTTDIVYGVHAGDLVLSHRFIIAGEPKDNQRVAVLTAHSEAHADEVAVIMQQGYPVDTRIIKERAAYSMMVDNYPVLIHLDRAVKDRDGNNLGSFIEFEIKTLPNETIPSKRKEGIFNTLEHDFKESLGDPIFDSYRNLIHAQFGDYGPWVKNLPEETFKELRNLPSFKVNKGDLIIRDFETRHHDGFFVMDGETRVFYQNGPEIRRIGKHDFFGEMACRSPEKRRNGNVEAFTDLTLKKVPEGLLNRLYLDAKLANHFLDRYLTDESKRTQLRMDEYRPV